MFKESNNNCLAFQKPTIRINLKHSYFKKIRTMFASKT